MIASKYLAKLIMSKTQKIGLVILMIFLLDVLILLGLMSESCDGCDRPCCEPVSGEEKLN